MTPYLLCCDWGTSVFRVRLMTRTGQCLGELSSHAGVASTFADWKAVGEPAGVARESFFRQQLGVHIQQLADQLTRRLAGIPVLISGMASSSIGMADVPYARLPFAIDGSQCSVRHYEQRTDFPHEISLFSGICTQRDVMRGEETQLIGLSSLLTEIDWQAQPSMFVFPGTHSKHIAVAQNQLVDFNTYMTGELFNLLVKQSILSDSIDDRNLVHQLANETAPFRKGVRESLTNPLLNSLFTVRTNDLFRSLSKRHNALYLSGLLIGSEMSTLFDKPDWQVLLCCGSNLSPFYQLAIHELGLSKRTILVPPTLVDQSASVGQIRLYQHQPLKSTTE